MSDLSGTAQTTGKVMMRFPGAEIRTTRESIFVDFENEATRIVSVALRGAGFRRAPDRELWSAAHNPANIMQAQAILTQHLGRAK